eukprot:CAMPEP_0204590268 /NCGR_PEP_ID=MMETSP0661-20131031/49694_1 /ASSEMBLY_ACC=CAM_ASM_000606 /TAXON_ID=109239 /ORGANISM="Alexandrium margalefi, Strain AMGDE01CS-322" /LENGTH=36 /DNA_ID= /DNA_START= /DNA_END= /DNA_ORIENTATION=
MSWLHHFPGGYACLFKVLAAPLDDARPGMRARPHMR